MSKQHSAAAAIDIPFGFLERRLPLTQDILGWVLSCQSGVEGPLAATAQLLHCRE